VWTIASPWLFVVFPGLCPRTHPIRILLGCHSIIEPCLMLLFIHVFLIAPAGVIRVSAAVLAGVIRVSAAVLAGVIVRTSILK
jgi:hypothetical protein